MPQPGLIIFDGDGVLYDTEPIVCRVQAEVMNALGYAITEADARQHIGKTGAEFYRAMEGRFAATLPGDMNERFVKRYREVLGQGLAPMPGAVKLLGRLAVPFCVATNSTRLRLGVTLEATGLTGLFRGRAFSVSEVARGKPAPDLFFHAADVMGSAPADCLVIDDNVHGIAAGIAAGMRVIGFVGGSHVASDQTARLKDAGAEAVAADMDALSHFLSNQGCLN